MSLLLGVIAVLAIVAGVALLATSGDRGFADVTPDSPDIALPDDRVLDADDVESVRFGLAFRGYRMQEVDEVLDRLAAEIATRDDTIRDLRAELESRAQAPQPRVSTSTATSAASPAATSVPTTPAAEPTPPPGPPVAVAFTPIEPAPVPETEDTPPAPVDELTQAMLAAAGAADEDPDVEPADEDPDGEPADTSLADATPAYIETVPLPETVPDDPALDAEQPDDPPPATTKPESQPAEPEVTMGLEQPAPEQAAEHRE